MRKLFIFGTGGHCKQVIDIFNKNNTPITGFFDDFKEKGETFYHKYTITDKINNAKNYITQSDVLFCAIGDNNIRKHVYTQFREFEFINCISPLSNISPTVIMGNGNYVGHFCNIMPDTIIGSQNILNDNSCICHDCTVGDFNLVAPTVCCGARIKIGNNNLFGIGSKIISKIIVIGNNNIIGAGAVIINDIGDNNMIVGIPGKIKNKINDRSIHVNV